MNQTEIVEVFQELQQAAKHLNLDLIISVGKKFMVYAGNNDPVHSSDSLDEVAAFLNGWNLCRVREEKRLRQNHFSIEQIKNYIMSQDSLGDVAHNLSAFQIREANKT